MDDIDTTLEQANILLDDLGREVDALGREVDSVAAHMLASRIAEVLNLRISREVVSLIEDCIREARL